MTEDGAAVILVGWERTDDNRSSSIGMVLGVDVSIVCGSTAIVAYPI